MSDNRRIEEVARKRLVADLGEKDGEQRFALYLTARKAVVEDILPNIKAVVPSLTDHGPEHVANVLENAGELLGVDSNPRVLSGVEYYSLIMSILFHDVGNILDREKHQRNIAQIYDFCRSEAERDYSEKAIVVKTTQAHCGQTDSGSKDTLKPLRDQCLPLCGKQVRVCDIAAVLRLSDELAEGRQRTSLFMQRTHQYKESSMIFHEYARIANVSIDRGNQRVALTYNVSIRGDANGRLEHKQEKALRDLIKYTYHRIEKLNQERKYARHYSELLSPFKMTTVVFNFWINEELCSTDLPDRVDLTDLVVPGEKDKSFCDHCVQYDVDNVVNKLKEHLIKVS